MHMPDIVDERENVEKWGM